MKKSLKNSLKEFNNFFEQEPSAKMQSWSLLDDFYHLILTYMQKNDIKPIDLANSLGVSRSAISQLFNRQPNVTLNKISEIAHSIGLKLRLTSEQVEQSVIEKKVIIKLAHSFVNFSEMSEEDLQKEKEVHRKEIPDSRYEIQYQQIRQ